MKLGLVLECDSGGPDELVLACFARRLKPGITIHPAALGSKEGIRLRGAETAAELVQSSGCELVLIVWDLKPLWKEVAAKDCKDEVAEMRKHLTTVKPDTKRRIRLLCLTYELETWLIADPRAVREHLSTNARKSKFKCNAPLSKKDPKAFLNAEFRRHRGRSRRYEDVREAIAIARLIRDTSKIRKIQSYRRFSNFVAGNANAHFQQAGDACNDLVHQAYMLGRT
jgi:hypothetical protein